MIMKSEVLLFIFFIAVATISACAQSKVNDNRLFGDWYGESKCVGNNPNCHDETVVYHISRSKTDPEKIHLAADKIIDGKPEPMGELDFDYDREKQTLTSEFKIPRTGGKGVWLLKINGDMMDGTLTVYPENEIGRRINVSKNKTAD